MDDADVPESARKKDESDAGEDGDKPKKKAPAKKGAKRKTEEDGDDQEEEAKPKRKKAVSTARFGNKVTRH